MVDAVAGRASVVVDDGFLRGTDIVMAIARGADMVGVGGLYGFGLAAGGRAGVLRVLEILEAEILSALALLGVTRLDELAADHLAVAAPTDAPGVLSAFPFLDLPAIEY